MSWRLRGGVGGESNTAWAFPQWIKARLFYFFGFVMFLLIIVFTFLVVIIYDLYCLNDLVLMFNSFMIFPKPTVL